MQMNCFAWDRKRVHGLRKIASGEIAVRPDTPTKSQAQKSPQSSGLLYCGDRKEIWLREQDLNLRPLGYEPNELPGCSIARKERV